MSVTLWLARHCESMGNIDVDEYLRTRNDHIDLSPKGQEQAATLGTLLQREMQGLAPNVIWCSPFQRAKSTAQIIAKTWNWPTIPVLEDVLLCEQVYGKATGCDSLEEYLSGHPDQHKLRDAVSPIVYQFPQGESRAQVAVRAETFVGKIHRLLSNVQFARVVAVAHKGFCCMMDQQLKGKYEDDLHWQNGEVRVYAFDERMRLQGWRVLEESLQLDKPQESH